MYWKLDGDGSITARLRSVEATDDWALAGIMIRESLNAADKFDGIVITPRGAISPQSRTGTEIHMEWKNTHKSNTNYKVRKTLHFTGYLILFLVFFWALQFIRIGKGKIILISTFLCAAIASLDEFNQSFSGGREPRVADVLIDTSGAALAALILLLITLIRRKQVKV